MSRRAITVLIGLIASLGLATWGAALVGAAPDGQADVDNDHGAATGGCLEEIFYTNGPGGFTSPELAITQDGGVVAGLTKRTIDSSSAAFERILSDKRVEAWQVDRYGSGWAVSHSMVPSTCGVPPEAAAEGEVLDPLPLPTLTLTPLPTLIPNDGTATREPPVGRCPSSQWKYFENPAVHYTLCLPPEWGFTDYDNALPLRTISRDRLGQLAALSKDGFPWTEARGETMYQDLASSKFVVLSLSAITSETALDRYCNPGKTADWSNVHATWCEDRLSTDPYKGPDKQGPIRRLVVVLKLQTPWNTGNPSDVPHDKLIITVKTGASRYEQQLDLYWQAVRTLKTT